NLSVATLPGVWNTPRVTSLAQPKFWTCTGSRYSTNCDSWVWAVGMFQSATRRKIPTPDVRYASACRDSSTRISLECGNLLPLCHIEIQTTLTYNLHF